jgi:hypothetical protein
MPNDPTARLLERVKNRAEILGSDHWLRGYRGFRPWAPKPRFSTLEHDFVRLRSLDDRREERARISRISTSRINGK